MTILLFFSGCILHPMEMHFSIRLLSSSDKTLCVTLEARHCFHNKQPLYLYKNAVTLSGLSVCDARKQSLVWRDSSGFIIIDSPKRIPRLVHITYTASINSFGRHGYEGGIFQDMTVFDGEHVLLLPKVVLNAPDSVIQTNVNRIVIDYEFPEDWTAIVPFSQGRSRTCVTRPTWLMIYQLVKSCYAFGHFDKHVCNVQTKDFTIAVDTLCRQSCNDEVRQGIVALYKYYTDIFHTELNDFSIVLLRPGHDDGLPLFGGLGTQTIGSTFDPNKKSDWSHLAHRLFHVFFDTRIPTAMFHKPPQLWLLEGLACYYEITALNSLPETLRKRVSIDDKNDFTALYRRYIYMRLKDTHLAIAPMKESSIRSSGKIEFLHYTQAPLLVKWVEDQGYNTFKSRNRILRYILRNYATLQSLEPVFSFAFCKNKEESIAQYLFGSHILPLWYLSSGSENSTEVINELNSFERILGMWFRAEIPGYPVDTLGNAHLSDLAAMAEKENAHFADEALEAEVAALSPTVYNLLMQYAMRAKICGIDLHDTFARVMLLGDTTNQRRCENYSHYFDRPAGCTIQNGFQTDDRGDE